VRCSELPRLTIKLEVHPLPAVRDILFNMGATLHTQMRFSIHKPRTRPAMLTAARLADSLGCFHCVDEPLVSQLQTHKWFGRTCVAWRHEHFSSIPVPSNEADQSQYDNGHCCCNTNCLCEWPNHKKVSQWPTGAHPAP